MIHRFPKKAAEHNDLKVLKVVKVHKVLKVFKVAVGRVGLFLMAWCCLMGLAACEGGDYETGDDEYSYMRADFVVARSAEAKSLAHAITDDGDSLVFDDHLACSWATTADSTYRALLYYHVDKQGSNHVKGISAKQVLVLRLPGERVKSTPTDPLAFESAWMSANGKYVNLGLDVKTGKTEDEARKQLLGVVRDTIVALGDGRREHRLRLLHAQNDVPQNYSTKVYVSIPMAGFAPGDVIVIDINTYDGLLTRTFDL